MKSILLTFDYELFFGKSGTLKKCILEPTDKLLSVFSDKNIRSTFFIDILYYLRLKDNKATYNESLLVKEQIIKIVGQGHRVELHLHPHWLDAKYDNGEWLFPDYRYYKLSALSEEKILELFVTGTKALEEIAKEALPDYKVLAFRAGGFCIQPFQKIKNAFVKTGIKVDSSVVVGKKLESELQSFDFMDAPELEYYKFNANPLLQESNGLFYEIPIASYNRTYINRLSRKIARRFNKDNYRQYGDGVGSGFNEKRDLLKEILPYRAQFSLENESPEILLTKVVQSTKNIITFVSHPKLLSNVSFESIDKLADQKISFLNIEDLIKNIETSNKPVSNTENR